MEKKLLQDYARLIAAMGANVEKGDEVWIEAGLDQPEFVYMVAEECYKLGAFFNVCAHRCNQTCIVL